MKVFRNYFDLIMTWPESHFIRTVNYSVITRWLYICKRLKCSGITLIINGKTFITICLHLRRTNHLVIPNRIIRSHHHHPIGLRLIEIRHHNHEFHCIINRNAPLSRCRLLVLIKSVVCLIPYINQNNPLFMLTHSLEHTSPEASANKSYHLVLKC